MVQAALEFERTSTSRRWKQRKATNGTMRRLTTQHHPSWQDPSILYCTRGGYRGRDVRAFNLDDHPTGLTALRVAAASAKGDVGGEVAAARPAGWSYRPHRTDPVRSDTGAGHLYSPRLNRSSNRRVPEPGAAHSALSAGTRHIFSDT